MVVVMGRVGIEVVKVALAAVKLCEMATALWE
jgi:hypothetical protein